MPTPHPDDLALLYRRGALTVPLGQPPSVEVVWIARHGTRITTRYPPVDLGTCYSAEEAGHVDYGSADEAARIFREIVATVLADDSAADAASPHSGRWAEADPVAFDPARPDTLRPITPVSDPAGNQSL
jgi:hypothetical protein